MNNQKFNKTLKDYDLKLHAKSNVCADSNTIFIKFENNKIKEIGYENSACALNTATLEIICNELQEKTKEELKQLNIEKIKKELNFPNSKTHCVKLVLDTLEN